MENQNKGICSNPWCKSTYVYVGDTPPGVCPKCDSFDNNLSGGVSWSTKVYNEPRDDGGYHEISINISTGNQNYQSSIGGGLAQFLKKMLKR